MSLTKRQQSFVNAYSGDLVATMRAIGEGGDESSLHAKGRALLDNPVVQEALRSRYTYTVDQKKNIADRNDLMEWWTGIMKNRDEHGDPEDKIPLRERLKASEYIGKAHIMFGEKKEIDVKQSITNIIEGAYKLKDTDIEDIDFVEKRDEAVAKALPMPELKEDVKSIMDVI